LHEFGEIVKKSRFELIFVRRLFGRLSGKTARQRQDDTKRAGAAVPSRQSQPAQAPGVA